MAPMTRRSFARNSAAAALALASGAAAAPAGVNERVRPGASAGQCGSHILKLFHDQPDVEIVAVCDVHERFLTRAKGRRRGAATYKDFRQVLSARRTPWSSPPRSLARPADDPGLPGGKEGQLFTPPPPLP